MKIVIASSNKVLASQWPVFCQQVTKLMPTITGLTLTVGMGAYNFGVYIDANKEQGETVANRLTMALMPAQWAHVPNDDPGVNPGEFRYDL